MHQLTNRKPHPVQLQRPQPQNPRRTCRGACKPQTPGGELRQKTEGDQRRASPDYPVRCCFLVCWTAAPRSFSICGWKGTTGHCGIGCEIPFGTHLVSSAVHAP